jgi:hypothetical protein
LFPSGCRSSSKLPNSRKAIGAPTLSTTDHSRTWFAAKNEAPGPALQVVDSPGGLEAVPADKDCFGAVAEVLYDPVNDHGRLDLTRIVGPKAYPELVDGDGMDAEHLYPCLSFAVPQIAWGKSKNRCGS